MVRRGREVIANVDRLQDHMDHNGLSAVVVRSGKNFTYLSGVSFPGTLARHLDLADSPRDVFVVWPRNGEPVIITNALGKPVVERDSWVARIEVVQDYVESPLEKLAKEVKNMGLDSSKIGFEKSYISAASWEELQGLLPRVEMSDCTEMMNSVRWVKTPGEIALLKRAADLQDEAHLEVFPTIRDGDTEREIHSRFVKSCLQLGCHFVHGILTSSRNASMYMGESDLAIRKGNIIRTDYVSYLEGYPGHQSRMACLGKPSDEQREMYRKYRDVYLKTIEKCRAGTRVSDIYFFAREMLLEYGFPHNPASFVGHSVGAWWHQQEPFLVKGWDVELEEGMVIAIEPYVGYWHIQDLVLVTGEGPQILSDLFDTGQLFVID